MRKGELKDQIMKRISRVYNLDSGVAIRVSKGLEKLYYNEMDGLLLMIATSIEGAKTRSVWDLCQEAIKKYGTKENTYDTFPVGTRVRVITPCQDFNFFFNEPRGVVVKNEGRYLGISVKWDNPRHFESGYVEEAFNFEPQDLILEEKNEKA